MILLYQKFYQRSSLTKLALYISLLFFYIPIQAETETIVEKSQTKTIQKGTFLLATNKLKGSSFNKTVILITHYGKGGATGIAINKPSELRLNQAFPNISQLSDNKEELYLGGPVRTQSIFVLMKTRRPDQNMKNIADDLYFAPGLKAFSDKKTKKLKNVRAFAGYAGWAPGQLEYEINRGDWIVIQSDLDIVFSDENSSLWKRLSRAWSGNWI